jgi:hypothetical protein
MGRFSIRLVVISITLCAIVLFTYDRTRNSNVYRRTHDANAFRLVMSKSFPNGSLQRDIEATLGKPNTTADPDQIERYKTGSFPDGYRSGDEFIAYELIDPDEGTYPCVLQFRAGKLVNTSHFDWSATLLTGLMEDPKP